MQNFVWPGFFPDVSHRKNCTFIAVKIAITRLHHSTTYVGVACCYRQSSVVCQSAKTAEPIEMLFGTWTLVGTWEACIR